MAIAQIVSLPVFLWYEENPNEIICLMMARKYPYLIFSGASFCVGQLCTNTSLSIVSVSLTHIIKITEPLVALFFGIAILKDDIKKEAILSMGIMLTGFVNATVYDTTFHMKGMIFAAVSNIALQVRNLYIKLSEAECKNGLKSITLFFLSNTISLIILLFPLIISQVIQPVAGLIRLDYQILSIGFFFAIQHIMSFFVLQHVFITTHALLNVLKRLFIIVICAVYLKTYVNMLQFVGIAIAFIGFYLYSMRMKSRSKLSKSLPPPQTNFSVVLCITSACIFLLGFFSL